MQEVPGACGPLLGPLWGDHGEGALGEDRHSITGDLEEAHSGQAVPTSSRFQESDTERNGGGEERRAKHRPRRGRVEPRPGAERGRVVARALHAGDEGS